MDSWHEGFPPFSKQINFERKMVGRDLWYADNGFSIQGKVLSSNVKLWPSPDDEETDDLVLRLEDLSHLHGECRIEARTRNLIRLDAAKGRQDVQHLDLPFNCCNDAYLYDALLDLLSHDDRTWQSFTLKEMNNTNDFFAKPISLESLCLLFRVLKTVKSLNLISCSSAHRGHGLEQILQSISALDGLKELRLEGWQMDRVSTSSLFEHLSNGETAQLLELSDSAASNRYFRAVRRLKSVMERIQKGASGVF